MGGGREPSIGEFDLVSNYPRQTFGAERRAESLEALGLHPQAMLFVHEIDDDDDDDAVNRAPRRGRVTRRSRIEFSHVLITVNARRDYRYLTMSSEHQPTLPVSSTSFAPGIAASFSFARSCRVWFCAQLSIAFSLHFGPVSPSGFFHL